MADSETQLVEPLVAANRILANEGIIDVLGHVSARSTRDSQEFLLSCSRSPHNVCAADIMRYRLDCTPVTQSSERPYAERMIHGAIYAVRPDVQAVVHTHSRNVLPFASSGVIIRPVIHAGTMFHDGVAWFDEYDAGGNLLVSTPTEGAALATALGQRSGVILRNHGCAVVGANLTLAVMAAFYLDENARVQMEATKLGRIIFIDAEEAQRAAKVFHSLLVQQRAWDYWLKRLPSNWRADADLA